MALVRKLQTGSKAPDPNNTPKDYSQVEKALYDNLYSMSSKEARRAKPAYDQVAALVKSGAMDKALKFNPDQTYSIDTSQLPEELKKFNWTGHDEPLSKDMLGLGVKIRGNDADKESLSSAMNALRTHIESTNSTTTPTAQTGYSKEVQGLTNIVSNKHYHDDVNALATHLNTFKTNDERKARVLGWAKEGVDDYLNDYTKNKDSYDYKDYDNAQALKLALSEPNPNWDKVTEKAYALGWKMNDYLIPPKTQTELDAEKKAADDAAALTAATAAKTAPVVPTPHKPQAYIRKTTTTYFHPKEKPTATGSGKVGDMLSGKGSTADYLDAIALGGDVVSLGGTAAGLAGGLTSTAATLGSDILRGHGFGETAGNAALNLGFTALSLIPGAASAKLGLKGAKTGIEIAKLATKAEKAEHILKIAKTAIKDAEGVELVGKELLNLNRAKAIVKSAEGLSEVEKVAKIAKYGIPETKALVKGAFKPASSIVSKAAKLAKPAFLGYGLVNAGTAARQTAQDIEEGGLGNVSIQDARGLVHGVQAVKGLYNLAQVHAGTTKIQTQEASTDFKLKNVPEGVESKITIPKGTDPEVAINEHFDKVIAPKKSVLDALNAKETPDEGAISKLKAEIETLDEAKKAAKIDKGWLGIKGKVAKVTGMNDNKAKSERVIKEESDPRSWYGKKFQESAISKLRQGEQKNLEKLKDPKVKAILGLDRANKATDYKRKISLNKAWNKYNKNMVEHKEGGVIQFQQGGAFKMDFSVLDKALKEGKLRKAGFTNETIGASGHTFTNNKGQSMTLPDSTKQPIISAPVINKPIVPTKLVGTIAPKVTVAPTANTTYKHPGSGNYLPYSDLKDVSTWQTKDGGYTPEYTNFVNGLDENWLARNKEDLNKFIQSAGSNVSVKDLAQVKGLATDNKYGPYHNYMTNKFNESATRLEPKNKGFDVAAVKLPTNLFGNTTTPTTQSGTTVNKQSEGIKFPKLNKVDLLNTAMYLNTVRTNKDIGNAQRKGVADSMYTLPYMSNTYIRADRPHTLEADKQAAAVNSKTARMAASTADIDKGFSVRLSGINQGNILKDKAQMADTQRLDQMRGQQLQMNANTAKYNTEVLGKNRGLAANAFGKIHGINALQSSAQNTALNVLLLANQKNDIMKKQREGQTGMFNILQDPKYKQLGEEYNTLADETNNSFRKNYDTQMKTPGITPIDWEKSSDYAKWQTALKAKESQIKPFNERLKNIQMAMMYGQSLKKGGQIAKKVEADRKQFYKVIHSVNNPVDKHNIDLSQTETNALDSDKLFYETIASNNKKVNAK